MKSHPFFSLPVFGSKAFRKGHDPINPSKRSLWFLLLLFFLNYSTPILPFPCAFAGDPNPSCPNVNPRDDLAVGVVDKTIGNLIGTGVINVLYGTRTGLAASGQYDDQLWGRDDLNLPGAAASGDRFGAALTVGDFDGDCFMDLAVGAPGESVAGLLEAGSVYVLYGSLPGLQDGRSQRWNLSSPGIIDVAGQNDQLGDALAVGDFNHDGFSDLAIGLPGKTVGGQANAGAVLVLYGSAAGLTAAGNSIWHQNVAGVPGVAEAEDLFGASLTGGDFNGDGYADLAIGVPWENFGAVDDGAVNILYGSAAGLGTVGAQVWTQTDLGLAAGEKDWFGSALIAGDFNGDGRMDLAIGAPGKGLGGTARGAVSVLYGNVNGLSQADQNNYFQQGMPGLGNGADYHLFGLALAAGDFDRNGYTDLAIGATGDGASGVARSGSVYVILGFAAGLSAFRQVWHQNLLNGSPAETGDRFGAALTVGDFNGDGYSDLAVGVPKEQVGAVAVAGAVNIIFGNQAGLNPAGNQYWTQNSPSVKGDAITDDRFGAALAAGNFGKPGYLYFPIILRN